MIDCDNGERYAVLLMDTQGTFDPSASGYQTSIAVFILSTMLSSVQCFNVADSLTDDVFVPLKFFTE